MAFLTVTAGKFYPPLNFTVDLLIIKKKKKTKAWKRITPLSLNVGSVPWNNNRAAKELPQLSSSKVDEDFTEDFTKSFTDFPMLINRPKYHSAGVSSSLQAYTMIRWSVPVQERNKWKINMGHSKIMKSGSVLLAPEPSWQYSLSLCYAFHSFLPPKNSLGSGCVWSACERENHPAVSISQSICTVWDSSARLSWRLLKCHPSIPAPESSSASASRNQGPFLAPALCSPSFPSLPLLSLALLAGMELSGWDWEGRVQISSQFQHWQLSLCFKLSPSQQFTSRFLPMIFSSSCNFL